MQRLNQETRLLFRKPHFLLHQTQLYHKPSSPPNPNPPRKTPHHHHTRDTEFISLARLKTQDPIERDDVDEFSTDVERIYRTLRKFHSRVPKLEIALQQSGIRLRPGLTERVINRVGDAGNLGYRFFAWASKQPGFTPSREVYKAMIKALGKMRQFGTVWALLEEMRTENPDMITPEVFVVLMRRFASARMVKNAIQVFDEMPKYGCEPDEYVFGCLLDALCKNGSVKEAALLFEEMRLKFTPNLRHFTSLLYGWCKERKIMEAKCVLMKMREAGFEPDTVVYNTLLGGYTMADKMTDAFDLLKEMKNKDGISPNAASYTILIQALCKRDKTEEAMRVFAEMERTGIEADAVAHTALLSGLCKSGELKKAYGILRRGFAPSETMFMHIMLAHEKKEELEECVELMTEMRRIGCFPDSSVYNVVIRLSCKLGEVEEGIRLWNEAEANGLSPGTDSFIVMIHGLINQDRHVEACKYFTEMVERGLLSAPQYGTVKEVMNKLLRAEKLAMAKEVWGSIVRHVAEVNVGMWTIWVHALFSAGHVKEACSYCLEMMEAGVMPQPDTFAKLMRGLKKLYNREIAAEITEKARKMAEERQMTFKMYKRRGERDLKEKIKEKMEGRKRRGRRRRWGSTTSTKDL